MKTRYALALALASLVAGCAAPSATPNFDQNFGKSVREARMRMALNPNAAITDPAAGLDGRSAREAQQRYVDSFKAPPPVVNIINIGGAVGGGGSQ